MISRNFITCFNRFITKYEQSPALGKRFYHSTYKALDDEQLIGFISFSRFKNRNCLAQAFLRNEISRQIRLYRVVRHDGLFRTVGVIIIFARSNQEGEEGEKGNLVHLCYVLFECKVIYEALRVCGRVGRRHFQPGGNPPIKPRPKQVNKPA